jgi:four helix bundle protein
MGNHRKLEVWHRARSFAARIDRVTRSFPKGYYELADQLRRASLSISTNISEGCGSGNDGDFKRYLGHSLASAGEVDSLLAHTEEVGVLSATTASELLEELEIIRRMLHKLRAAIDPKRKLPKQKTVRTQQTAAARPRDVPTSSMTRPDDIAAGRPPIAHPAQDRLSTVD